jgi:epoxyqueuosine reductase
MEEQDKAREFTEILGEVAFSSYVTVFGAASFRGREREAPGSLPFSLSELPHAVSIGFRLSDAVIDSLVDRPTRTYQYHYRQVNLFIDQTLLRLLGKIHELGYKGFPVPSSQIVNWESNAGHLAHKVVAREAGLGWIGRNNLLVSPIYGARVRYGSLFTNLPLATPKMAVPQGCGECFRCLKACPASAIGETRESFDLGKCTEMLKLFTKEENIGSMICGLCVKACRGTQRCQSFQGNHPRLN